MTVDTNQFSRGAQLKLFFDRQVVIMPDSKTDIHSDRQVEIINSDRRKFRQVDTYIHTRRHTNWKKGKGSLATRQK